MSQGARSTKKDAAAIPIAAHATNIHPTQLAQNTYLCEKEFPMDLQDQLKNLFPEHQPQEPEHQSQEQGLWIPDDPIACHYEKRNGKPHTIIKGYTGHSGDFKQLAKDIKKMLGVGGSTKNGEIIIQGDYRDQIMTYLQDLGMKVKRVGG